MQKLFLFIIIFKYKLINDKKDIENKINNNNSL